jgi:porin
LISQSVTVLMRIAFLGLALGSASMNLAAENADSDQCSSLSDSDSYFGCGFESGAEAASCGESLFGFIKPLTCQTLTGHWFGARTHLADSGVTVNANVTQFYMGAVSEGLDNSARYSGHGDYVANLDAGQLLGMTGMFIKLRAEHRFGESMSGTTGALLPSNSRRIDKPDRMVFKRRCWR